MPQVQEVCPGPVFCSLGKFPLPLEPAPHWPVGITLPVSLCLRASKSQAVKCSEIYEAPDKCKGFLLLLFWHFPNM